MYPQKLFLVGSITSGNVESVITWFENPKNQFRFLCLLIAGHLNDGKFFSDVFDKEEALDVVSEHEIAVLLFSNTTETVLFFEVDEGQHQILPGRLYKPRGDYFEYKYLSRVSEFGVRDLKHYLRDSKIKTSQTISDEICMKYHLEVDDVPCILLLAKEEPEPFIIRTKGEIDIEHFFQLLKDVRKLTQELPKKYEIQDSIESAKLLINTEQASTKKAWVTESENALNESINEVRNTLNKFGVPVSICEIVVNQQTAKNLWEVLGRVPIAPAHPVIAEYSEAIEKALNESNLKRQIKLVIKNAKNVSVAINYRKSAVKKLKKLFPELHTASELINSLCQDYERKFNLKAKYRPIKQFIEIVLGISAKTRELLSLEESIKKII